MKIIIYMREDIDFIVVLYACFVNVCLCFVGDNSQNNVYFRQQLYSCLDSNLFTAVCSLSFHNVRQKLHLIYRNNKQ